MLILMLSADELMWILAVGMARCAPAGFQRGLRWAITR